MSALVLLSASVAAAALMGSIVLQLANDRPAPPRPRLIVLELRAPREPGLRVGGCDLRDAYLPQWIVRPTHRPMWTGAR